jgi:hypothetical protein
MAAPPVQPTIAPTEVSVSTNDNLTISGKNVSLKTAYFKFGDSVTSDNTILEAITKDTDKIEVNDKIIMQDGNSYIIKEIEKTNVQFASGTALVSKAVSVRFPRPEAKTYAPEKVATFLIFKK